jgi:hypothetical protein
MYVSLPSELVMSGLSSCSLLLPLTLARLCRRTAASENYKYSGGVHSIEAWRGWAYGIRDESVRLITHLTWEDTMSYDSWFIKLYVHTRTGSHAIASLPFVFINQQRMH